MLFACARSTAIYLKLVSPILTSETQLVIRQSLSPNSGCVPLISDNEIPFVKAASDIKRVFNSVRGSTFL